MSVRTAAQKNHGGLKKAVFLSLFILLFGSLCHPWEIINAPDNYTYPFGQQGERNYLPHFLNGLEKMHGITVFLHIHKGKGDFDIRRTADFLLAEKTGGMEGKFVYIIAAPALKKAALSFSPGALAAFDYADIEILEKHIAPALLGRSFIPEKRAVTKIAGTLYYFLEKKNMGKEQLEMIKEHAVITGGGWYKASLTEPFNTFIRLFYFEPFSFIYYFPMVTFFLLVRIPGRHLGIYAYRNLTVIWVIFMVVMAFMTGARVNAYVPEYVRLFSLFMGFNFPVYIYIIAFYSREIEHAAYNYITEIKGGFAAGNEFEGKRWH